MTKDVLTCVKSQEVKLMVSSPKLASGITLQGNIHDFESLDEIIRFTRVCELALFPHRVQMGGTTKLDPRKSRNCAAITGGTIFGPVIEVQIVKIIDRYGL